MSDPRTASANETFTQTYLATILPAVPVPPGMTRAEVRTAVQVVLGVLRPGNPAETLLAGLYIATLFGGIESLRQADAPDLTPALACRLRSSGFSAIRLMLTLGGRLEQLRGDQPGANLPGVEAMSAMLAAGAARQFNPMPSEKRPECDSPPGPAPAARPAEPAPPPREPAQPAAPQPQRAAAPLATTPAARPFLPPAPPGTLTRKARKAAKYALRRAMKAAAQPASPGAPTALAAPAPRA